MDIMPDFGSVVPGSSPGRCTKVKQNTTLRSSVFVLGTENFSPVPLCKTETCFSPFPKEKNRRVGVENA